jgi:hypothetical protein
MDWTRREILAAAGAAVCAATLPAIPAGAFAGQGLPFDGPDYLQGDPYLATTSGPGLGGRSFEEARERALRFRTPAHERDRHALGVDSGEIPSRA